MTAGVELSPDLEAAVRRTVRSILEQSPGFACATPEVRRAVAQNLVNVSLAAARLVQADHAQTAMIQSASQRTSEPSRGRVDPGLARAQAAGGQLGLQATRAAPQQLRALRDAIDFPEFVTSLISGTFQAITRSNLQQIESLSDLLENLSVSVEEFAATNVPRAQAIAWAVQRFSFLTTEGRGDQVRLVMREGADLGSQTELLQRALGSEARSIDESDLDGTLLPLVQRAIGRQRQQSLATLVQLGMQRVVVDEGRLHASMEMRVDARSASEQVQDERSDFRLNAGASASVGVGPWGASANVSTSIGKVTSDHQLTQEEVASRAGLRSSVDLAFRTEQVPLDRMVGPEARVRIDRSARVPISVADGSLLTARGERGPASGDIPTAPAAPPRASSPGSPGPGAAARPGTTTAGSGAPEGPGSTPSPQGSTPSSASGSAASAGITSGSTPASASASGPSAGPAPPTTSGSPPAAAPARR